MAARNEQKGDNERGDRPYKDLSDETLRGEIARLNRMVFVVGSRQEIVLRGLRAEYAVRMAEASRGILRSGAVATDYRLGAEDVSIVGEAPRDETDPIVDEAPGGDDDPIVDEAPRGGDYPMMAFRDKVIAALQGQMGLSGNAGELGASLFDDSTAVGPQSIMLDPRMPLGAGDVSEIDGAPSEMDRLTPPPIPPDAR